MYFSVSSAPAGLYSRVLGHQHADYTLGGVTGNVQHSGGVAGLDGEHLAFVTQLPGLLVKGALGKLGLGQEDNGRRIVGEDPGEAGAEVGLFGGVPFGGQDGPAEGLVVIGEFGADTFDVVGGFAHYADFIKALFDYDFGKALSNVSVTEDVAEDVVAGL